jgi:hypothetical protein
LAIRRFLEPSMPQLVILSYQELPTETQIEPFGAIALSSQSLPTEIMNEMAVPEQMSPESDPLAFPVT